MNRAPSRPPEIALPVASLRALRASIADEIGPDSAAVVLRAAGHAAGDAFLAALAASSGARGATGDARGGSLGDLHHDAFWRRLGELFAGRGWGRVRFRQLHEGVGALDSSDWVEADAEGEADRPSCHFTTGMLANLLGGVAGGEVAVLEAECRSRGDERCVFLFGARETLDVVFDDLLSGADLERALLELV